MVRGRLIAGLVLLGLSVGGCQAARFEGAARGVVPAVRNQGELAASLLRVEDLAEGYGAASAGPAAPRGPRDGAQPCADVLEQLRGGDPAFAQVAAASARVEFGRGDYGPFLQQFLLSSADRAAVSAAVAAFRELPKLCDGFTETDELGSFTVKLAAADGLPALGDESVALKLDANGRSIDLDVTMSGYMIMFRDGSTVCIVIHFGIPGVDPGETEKIARAAVARLA